MAIGDGVSAIASLAVTFGGFSPTAMDGVHATREQIERMEAQMAEKREQAKRLREIEFARTSKQKSFEDKLGNVWRYVIVDGSSVRIESCETDAEILQIPGEIEGFPVVNLAPDSCAELGDVREIACPDSVEIIGACAFRLNPKLRKVVLSASVSDYKPSWFQTCPNMEDLTLPGKLDVLPRSAIDDLKLRSLHLGPNVYAIEPGAFQHSQLECIEIDGCNPYMFTDGTAIYSHDGKVLLALAKQVPSYAIIDSCTTVAPKACYGFLGTHQVSFPGGLKAIGKYSFSHSGLIEVDIPSSVEIIDERAFHHCQELSRATLHEGIEHIGDSAFEDTSLSELLIPASIERLGRFITSKTKVVHAGPDCTLGIDPGSEYLFLDGNGGLYRREEDGPHLVQLMDRDAEEYTVLEGAVCINAGSFVGQDTITSVVVPDGVKIIEQGAFRHCTSLRRVELADSVEYIGDKAFLDTNLESFRVPAALEYLGENALVTARAHRGQDVPSLVSVEVAHGNARFYVTQGMLCRRDDDGDHVVIFSNSAESVELPESIVGIDAYAFNNARGIRRLSLNKELRLIGTAGLATWCWIEDIHVEVEEPLEGRTSFDFRFPDTPRGIHAISQGIGGATWVNIPGIMAQYDNCLANAHDYNSPRNPDSIGSYEQVTRILDRLRDPILLTQVNRSMYDRLLRNHLVEICVDVARHDDRAVIDYLAELGYLNEDNLEDVIVEVGKLQDAATSGHLLEMKRLRFGKSAFDFDL